MSTDKLSRRALGGLAAAGVSVPLLAACGGSSDSASDTSADSSSGTSGGSSGGGSPTTGSSAGGSGGTSLTKTSDIDSGGGRVFPDQEVVVTQPASGDFKCFSAVCTHQGCLVSGVSDGTIDCNCHGSQFSIEDGSVIQGPASSPLAEVPITVTGDEIKLA
jgi:Rieske Fe-S protein